MIEEIRNQQTGSKIINISTDWLGSRGTFVDAQGKTAPAKHTWALEAANGGCWTAEGYGYVIVGQTWQQ